MEKVFFLSIIISMLFGIVKFLEMKFLDKEIKPLKEIVRSIFIVFISTFCCLYLFFSNETIIDDFLSVITNSTKKVQTDTTQVFTGAPDF